MERQALDIYKPFIDEIVELSPGVHTRRIKGDGWPETAENAKINKVLGELTLEQKEVFALIAQSAHDSGIHDLLVYLTDQINLKGLEIVKNGVRMASEPFGSDM